MKHLGAEQRKRGLRAPFSVPFRTGFTVVEFIVTIVLIGVMAAVFTPRFLGQQEFRVATAKNELLSVARYAQQAALWRGVGARVQLVFDTTAREIRVQVVDEGANCAGTALVNSTIRRIPMTEGKNYVPAAPDGQRRYTGSWAEVSPGGSADLVMVVQFDPLGALEASAGACPSLVELDLASNPDSEHGDICIEPSGYAHEGACFCKPDVGGSPGEGCSI